MGYLEPAEWGAIVPPVLAPNVQFDITNAMIQLLNLKGVFSGAAKDDANMHLTNFVGICTNYNIQGVNQEALRLRLFPFSLTGEGSLWLGELLRGSITTWYELKRQFLNRFFPPAQILQLKDEIYNFRQLPAESMYEAWFRFKKKLSVVPNHRIRGSHLPEFFYRSLNESSRAMIDTISVGAFMRLRWEAAQEMLDDIAVTNRGWHTRDSERSGGTYAIGASNAHGAANDMVAQEVAQLRTNIGLLTKQFASMSAEKVKVVATQGTTSKPFEIESEEEANFLNRRLADFRAQGQGNQGI